MAFGTHAPMENLNYPDFHLDPAASPDDPDAQQSGNQGIRNAFGGNCGGTPTSPERPIRSPARPPHISSRTAIHEGLRPALDAPTSPSTASGWTASTTSRTGTSSRNTRTPRGPPGPPAAARPTGSSWSAKNSPYPWNSSPSTASTDCGIEPFTRRIRSLLIGETEAGQLRRHHPADDRLPPGRLSPTVRRQSTTSVATTSRACATNDSTTFWTTTVSHQRKSGSSWHSPACSPRSASR